MYLELRQVVLVNGKEFIGHLPNLGQGEDSSGQRVVTDGAVDHHRVAGNGGLHGHFLDAAGELGQQGTFGREVADVEGMESGAVHQHRDFHAGVLWQIGNQVSIADISIEAKRLTTP